MYIAPLQPDKKLPYTGESWLSMRSRDENQIRQWFKERPNMNYAVSPGENFVVLDLDTKKGKDGVRDLDVNLQTLEYGIIDDAIIHTFTVQTPSKGYHRAFSTGGVPYSIAHTLPKSIDVRGMDGYVVGPGCYTKADPTTGTVEGEYEIVNQCDIMPLPEWIKPRLKVWVPREDRASYEDSVEVGDDGKAYIDGVELDQPERIQRAVEWLEHGAKPAIEYEGGNETTFKTFAWLREHGISTKLSLELVAKHYNPRACRRLRPGSDTFLPAPWSMEELERIRDNAYKYAKREVSHDGGMAMQFQSEEEIASGMQSISLEAVLAQFQQETDRADAQLKIAGIEEQRKRDNDLDAHTWYGEGSLDYPAKKEFIIPRVLPAYGYVGFLARRGTGKTTVMVDLALRLAHDMDWHGQPMKPGWGSLLLAGEDAEGIKDQILAWKAMHGVETLSERFVFMDAITNLLDPNSVVKWNAHFEKISKDRRFAVFADTWQIATAGGSQNEDDKMQIAIANTKAIGKIVRGPAIMAAHPPKGNEDTWSGAAVMENHSQALWKLTKESFGMKFAVPRIKGTRADFYALFEFRPQLLGGLDDWGQPNTGIVPVKLGGEGLVQTEEQVRKLRSARQAYGEVIYGLINVAEETEEQFARKRVSAFSLSGTARRIQEAAAKGMVGGLKAIGEDLSDVNAVKRRLEELFKGKNNTAAKVDFVGGQTIVVYLHQVPGKQTMYFKVSSRKPQVGEDDLSTPEPDEEQQIDPDESVR